MLLLGLLGLLCFLTFWWIWCVCCLKCWLFFCLYWLFRLLFSMRWGFLSSYFWCGFLLVFIVLLCFVWVDLLVVDLFDLVVLFIGFICDVCIWVVCLFVLFFDVEVCLDCVTLHVWLVICCIVFCVVVRGLFWCFEFVVMFYVLVIVLCLCRLGLLCVCLLCCCFGLGFWCTAFVLAGDQVFTLVWFTLLAWKLCFGVDLYCCFFSRVWFYLNCLFCTFEVVGFVIFILWLAVFGFAFVDFVWLVLCRLCWWWVDFNWLFVFIMLFGDFGCCFLFVGVVVVQLSVGCFDLCLDLICLLLVYNLLEWF